MGQTVRTSGGVSAVLKLADGSRVEMRSQSELSLGRTENGVRILLSNGSVIVNAAKQREGRRLYVQTKDVTVSVAGTVFLVNAEEEGSRVAVIEGEIRVQQQSTAERTLLAGEQVTTHALMRSKPVAEEISWSRNFEAHLAQLPQPATPVRSTQVAPQWTNQNPEAAQPIFEVASVRPSTPDAPGGRGGGGNVTISTGPCKGGGTLQIDPRRFVVTGATLYYLITAAYGMGNCVATTDLVFGGSDWIRSDRFDIEAVIPEGSPGYSRDQFNNGEAPRLQLMLQNLLADRFKLEVRRETREMPVYLLESTTRGAKLTSWKEGDFYTRRHIVAIPYYIEGGKASISDLADALRIVTGRTVLDQTGIGGDFTFALSFAPLNAGLMRRIGNAEPVFDTRPSLFTVLEEELGLRLRASKARWKCS